MGAILQITPVIDSITHGSSDAYANQLNAASNYPVTFVVTGSSSDFIVYDDGAFESTGLLDVGSYSMLGTMSDSQGNTGTWTFMLSVTGDVSPQVAVIPGIVAPPTGTEVKVPFHIDPATGAVAVITDYASILAQHIETIIMTAENERVMLANYGVGLEYSVFTPISNDAISFDAQDIQTQLKAWEPAVRIDNVSVGPDSSAPNRLVVTVAWSIIPLADQNTLTVTVGGGLQQVVAS